MKKLKTRLSTVFAVCFIFGLVGCAIQKETIDECVKLCDPNGGMLNIQDGPVGCTCRCANGLIKTI